MMTKGWLIVVSAEHVDGSTVVARFIVAIADRDRAIAAVGKRQLPNGAKVLVFGEAPETVMAFLNAVPGGVYEITALI